MEKENLYKQYQNAVDKTLKLFESNLDWPDLILNLAKIQKIIANHKNYDVIPYKYILANKINQCLNPTLPSGLHLNALKLLKIIFSIIGPKNLYQDIHLYIPGLLALFPKASLSVKPAIYEIFQEFFLKNYDESNEYNLIVENFLNGLFNSFFSGVEVGSEFICKINYYVDSIYETTIEAIRKNSLINNSHLLKHKLSNFYISLWQTVIINPTTRSFIFNYMIENKRRLKQDLYILLSYDDTDVTVHYSNEDILIYRNIIIEALIISLKDPNILVKRTALDVMLCALPLALLTMVPGPFTKSVDDLNENLVEVLLELVIDRNMSIQKRVLAWFFPLVGSESISDNTSFQYYSQDHSPIPTYTTAESSLLEAGVVQQSNESGRQLNQAGDGNDCCELENDATIPPFKKSHKRTGSKDDSYYCMIKKPLGTTGSSLKLTNASMKVGNNMNKHQKAIVDHKRNDSQIAKTPESILATLGDFDSHLFSSETKLNMFLYNLENNLLPSIPPSPHDSSCYFKEYLQSYHHRDSINKNRQSFSIDSSQDGATPLDSESIRGSRKMLDYRGELCGQHDTQTVYPLIYKCFLKALIPENNFCNVSNPQARDNISRNRKPSFPSTSQLKGTDIRENPIKLFYLFCNSSASVDTHKSVVGPTLLGKTGNILDRMGTAKLNYNLRDQSQRSKISSKQFKGMVRRLLYDLSPYIVRFLTKSHVSNEHNDILHSFKELKYLKRLFAAKFYNLPFIEANIIHLQSNLLGRSNNQMPSFNNCNTSFLESWFDFLVMFNRPACQIGQATPDNPAAESLRPKESYMTTLWFHMVNLTLLSVLYVTCSVFNSWQPENEFMFQQSRRLLGYLNLLMKCKIYYMLSSGTIATTSNADKNEQNYDSYAFFSDVPFSSWADVGLYFQQPSMIQSYSEIFEIMRTLKGKVLDTVQHNKYVKSLDEIEIKKLIKSFNQHPSTSSFSKEEVDPSTFSAEFLSEIIYLTTRPIQFGNLKQFTPNFLPLLYGEYLNYSYSLLDLIFPHSFTFLIKCLSPSFPKLYSTDEDLNGLLRGLADLHLTFFIYHGCPIFDLKGLSDEIITFGDTIHLIENAIIQNQMGQTGLTTFSHAFCYSYILEYNLYHRQMVLDGNEAYDNKLFEKYKECLTCLLETWWSCGSISDTQFEEDIGCESIFLSNFVSYILLSQSGLLNNLVVDFIDHKLQEKAQIDALYFSILKFNRFCRFLMSPSLEAICYLGAKCDLDSPSYQNLFTKTFKTLFIHLTPPDLTEPGCFNSIIITNSHSNLIGNMIFELFQDIFTDIKSHDNLPNVRGTTIILAFQSNLVSCLISPFADHLRNFNNSSLSDHDINSSFKYNCSLDSSAQDTLNYDFHDALTEFVYDSKDNSIIGASLPLLKPYDLTHIHTSLSIIKNICERALSAAPNCCLLTFLTSSLDDTNKRSDRMFNSQEPLVINYLLAFNLKIYSSFLRLPCEDASLSFNNNSYGIQYEIHQTITVLALEIIKILIKYTFQLNSCTSNCTNLRISIFQSKLENSFLNYICDTVEIVNSSTKLLNSTYKRLSPLEILQNQDPGFEYTSRKCEIIQEILLAMVSCPVITITENTPQYQSSFYLSKMVNDTSNRSLISKTLLGLYTSSFQDNQISYSAKWLLTRQRELWLKWFSHSIHFFLKLHSLFLVDNSAGLASNPLLDLFRNDHVLSQDVAQCLESLLNLLTSTANTLISTFPQSTNISGDGNANASLANLELLCELFLYFRLFHLLMNTCEPGPIADFQQYCTFLYQIQFLKSSIDEKRAASLTANSNLIQMNVRGLDVSDKAKILWTYFMPFYLETIGNVYNIFCFSLKKECLDRDELEILVKRHLSDIFQNFFIRFPPEISDKIDEISQQVSTESSQIVNLVKSFVDAIFDSNDSSLNYPFMTKFFDMDVCLAVTMFNFVSSLNNQPNEPDNFKSLLKFVLANNFLNLETPNHHSNNVIKILKLFVLYVRLDVILNFYFKNPSKNFLSTSFSRSSISNTNEQMVQCHGYCVSLSILEFQYFVIGEMRALTPGDHNVDKLAAYLFSYYLEKCTSLKDWLEERNFSELKEDEKFDKSYKIIQVIQILRNYYAILTYFFDFPTDVKILLNLNPSAPDAIKRFWEIVNEISSLGLEFSPTWLLGRKSISVLIPELPTFNVKSADESLPGSQVDSNSPVVIGKSLKTIMSPLNSLLNTPTIVSQTLATLPKLKIGFPHSNVTEASNRRSPPSNLPKIKFAFSQISLSPRRRRVMMANTSPTRSSRKTKDDLYQTSHPSIISNETVESTDLDVPKESLTTLFDESPAQGNDEYVNTLSAEDRTFQPYSDISASTTAKPILKLAITTLQSNYFSRQRSRLNLLDVDFVPLYHEFCSPFLFTHQKVGSLETSRSSKTFFSSSSLNPNLNNSSSSSFEPNNSKLHQLTVNDWDLKCKSNDLSNNPILSAIIWKIMFANSFELFNSNCSDVLSSTFDSDVDSQNLKSNVTDTSGTELFDMQECMTNLMKHCLFMGDLFSDITVQLDSLNPLKNDEGQITSNFKSLFATPHIYGLMAIDKFLVKLIPLVFCEDDITTSKDENGIHLFHHVPPTLFHYLKERRSFNAATFEICCSIVEQIFISPNDTTGFNSPREGATYTSPIWVNYRNKLLSKYRKDFWDLFTEQSPNNFFQTSSPNSLILLGKVIIKLFKADYYNISDIIGHISNVSYAYTSPIIQMFSRNNSDLDNASRLEWLKRLAYVIVFGVSGQFDNVILTLQEKITDIIEAALPYNLDGSPHAPSKHSTNPFHVKENKDVTLFLPRNRENGAFWTDKQITLRHNVLSNVYLLLSCMVFKFSPSRMYTIWPTVITTTLLIAKDLKLNLSRLSSHHHLKVNQENGLNKSRLVDCDRIGDRKPPLPSIKRNLMPRKSSVSSICVEKNKPDRPVSLPLQYLDENKSSAKLISVTPIISSPRGSLVKSHSMNEFSPNSMSGDQNNFFEDTSLSSKPDFIDTRKALFDDSALQLVLYMCRFLDLVLSLPNEYTNYIQMNSWCFTGSFEDGNVGDDDSGESNDFKQIAQMCLQPFPQFQHQHKVHVVGEETAEEPFSLRGITSITSLSDLAPFWRKLLHRYCDIPKPSSPLATTALESFLIEIFCEGYDTSTPS